MLFLFEYRAATLLIRTQFPGSAAAAISRISVDDDIISLDGRDPLRAEPEIIDDHGRIRVRIRRSTSTLPESAVSSSLGITPRASNLSNAEVFSVNTPVVAPHYNYDQSQNNTPNLLEDVVFSGYASSDAYSLQPTPRPSNFNELDTAATTTATTPTWALSPVAGKVFRQTPSPAFSGVKMMSWESPGKYQQRQGCKDVTGAGTCKLHVFFFFFNFLNRKVYLLMLSLREKKI